VPVFSTHLDYYNTAHRTAQLLDLMNWTAQHGARRIVAGDFNSMPGEYWITTMLGDYNDTWQDVTGSASGGGTINGARFDYLFRAKQGGDAVRPIRISVPQTNLSDHAPVIADYLVAP
jgi:endonuclease/exonuclease/phosphatase family metal-dependent hydrolase